jgi:ribosomal protein S18 acetylase RimI-like enzyme
MNAAERADLLNALNHLQDDASVLFVAEREVDRARVGFIYATTAVDFFTGEQHAHIKDIVVAKEGEGQGCGRVLLAAAEDWARARGYRFITLSVFPENRRAVELYERVGYETDVLRMLKTVG